MSSAQAQDVRYISDKQYVPLRSGAGNEYRITHRGLPSGTRLTVNSESDNGEWSQVTTDTGLSGWMRSQYLMKGVPAQVRLDAALAKAGQAGEQSSALQEELQVVQAERDALLEQLGTTETELAGVAEELAQLKQISGNAVKLDEDNRHLVVRQEELRSEVEMLKAENLRLVDKIESEDFLNGALAVLLGVIITLVVPRLWPKRRKSSSWA
ncbi:MAG: TIGR04211 family SH3 domain-containing protein [Halieaceae bacterium]|nr:TIGR04211 family SH3 domain-containing protein [Halieaceae bacterium]MCP5202683.1 TIGR04211 family SH3 domain-containing protein [Pseudomonadales bacterium]